MEKKRDNSLHSSALLQTLKLKNSSLSKIASLLVFPPFFSLVSSPSCWIGRRREIEERTKGQCEKSSSLFLFFYFLSRFFFLPSFFFPFFFSFSFFFNGYQLNFLIYAWCAHVLMGGAEKGVIKKIAGINFGDFSLFFLLFHGRCLVNVPAPLSSVRPNFSQCQCLKATRSINFKYFRNVNWRILTLFSFETFGRVMQKFGTCLGFVHDVGFHFAELF